MIDLDVRPVLSITVAGRVVGRNRASQKVGLDATIFQPELTKLPANKIGKEIAQIWKAAQADEQIAGQALCISIRFKRSDTIHVAKALPAGVHP